MSKSPQADGNALLNRLPDDIRLRLIKKMQRIRVSAKHNLYQAHGRIDYAYFPLDCVTSAVTVMQDGRAIEVATVGKEGAVGLPTFVGADTSPHRVFIQIAGETLRIDATTLKEETERDKSVRELLARYVVAFVAQVSQSVACNGLHAIEKRCCRWLLLTHDRVGKDELALTHEFLAIMLGVRRASVGEVLQSLEKQKLIRNSRGSITILHRKRLEAKSCECYQNVNEEYRRQLGG
jgi:CRP-like cAMP-binding protein